MEISIRPYAEADREVVTAIWFDSWESTGVVPPDASLRAELRDRLPKAIADGWLVHVAVAKSGIVGFLALQGDKLEQLFIAPPAQGQRVGKQLLDFAKAKRPSGLCLTTALDSRAPKFYEREGFKPDEITVHPRFGHRVIRYDWP